VRGIPDRHPFVLGQSIASQHTVASTLDYCGRPGRYACGRLALPRFAQ
jgi:hypothetical protein